MIKKLSVGPLLFFFPRLLNYIAMFSFIVAMHRMEYHV